MTTVLKDRICFKFLMHISKNNVYKYVIQFCDRLLHTISIKNEAIFIQIHYLFHQIKNTLKDKLYLAILPKHESFASEN